MCSFLYISDMPRIYDYIDYRKFIVDYYQEQKASCGFTWRNFACAACFKNPVYLKQVSDGKYNLSKDAAPRVALSMKLNKVQAQFFCLLVEFGNARGRKEKSNAYRKLLEISREHKVKILGSDYFTYFNSWKNPVLRELAPMMPGAAPLAMAHALRPQISAAEIRKSLQFLEKKHLLVMDSKGRYRQTDKVISMGSYEIVPLVATNIQREMAAFAMEAIDGLPVKERDISGITMSLSKEAYKKVAHQIAVCRKNIMDIVRKDHNESRIYRVNFQLFPLTEDLDCRNEE